ncbi:predicted protein [Plenodomus lingam JN3]|uniref:Uncharacterized protein n=1 Tax=Leptosphaeria maculans (strain JN3 / isolate v23.1.3 / race Av1-4-5-6-7-8) TaxID=985895 RepID=E5A5Y9_LEPMJ|nr:predicted protein [Plenodomus lingam JN3]CBX99034.1 predicted protein [Plenodomus lingam JN3]
MATQLAPNTGHAFGIPSVYPSFNRPVPLLVLPSAAATSSIRYLPLHEVDPYPGRARRRSGACSLISSSLYGVSGCTLPPGPGPTIGTKSSSVSTPSNAAHAILGLAAFTLNQRAGDLPPALAPLLAFETSSEPLRLSGEARSWLTSRRADSDHASVLHVPGAESIHTFPGPAFLILFTDHSPADVVTRDRDGPGARFHRCKIARHADSPTIRFLAQRVPVVTDSAWLVGPILFLCLLIELHRPLAERHVLQTSSRTHPTSRHGASSMWSSCENSAFFLTRQTMHNVWSAIVCFFQPPTGLTSLSLVFVDQGNEWTAGASIACRKWRASFPSSNSSVVVQSRRLQVEMWTPLCLFLLPHQISPRFFYDHGLQIAFPLDHQGKPGPLKTPLADLQSDPKTTLQFPQANNMPHSHLLGPRPKAPSTRPTRGRNGSKIMLMVDRRYNRRWYLAGAADVDAWAISQLWERWANRFCSCGEVYIIQPTFYEKVTGAQSRR